MEFYTIILKNSFYFFCFLCSCSLFMYQMHVGRCNLILNFIFNMHFSFFLNLIYPLFMVIYVLCVMCYEFIDWRLNGIEYIHSWTCAYSHIYNWFRLLWALGIEHRKIFKISLMIIIYFRVSLRLCKMACDCQLFWSSTCFVRIFIGDHPFSFILKALNIFHCKFMTTSTLSILSLINVDWWQVSAKCEFNFQSYQTQQIQLLIKDTIDQSINKRRRNRKKKKKIVLKCKDIPMWPMLVNWHLFIYSFQIFFSIIYFVLLSFIPFVFIFNEIKWSYSLTDNHRC